MEYQHLTLTDRYIIELLLNCEMPHAFIAETLGVHRSTVYREVKRNSHFNTYHHQMAHASSMNRKVRGKALFKKVKIPFNIIKYRFRRGWDHPMRYSDDRTFRDRVKKFYYRLPTLNRKERREEEYDLLRRPGRAIRRRTFRRKKNPALYPEYRERYYFRASYRIKEKLIRKRSASSPPPGPEPPVLSRPRSPVKSRPVTITPTFRPLRTRASRKTAPVCPKTETMQKTPHFPVPDPLVQF